MFEFLVVGLLVLLNVQMYAIARGAEHQCAVQDRQHAELLIGLAGKHDEDEEYL